MNKRETNKVITASLAASMMIVPFIETASVVEAKEVKENTSAKKTGKTITANQSDEQVYLSSMEYDKTQSGAAWGDIVRDGNTDGLPIKLLVDGEVTEFEKGMGAHATSTLVYDVRPYKDTYSRFVSYVGVDHRQAGKGDGVAFSIYTSENGQDWDLAKDIGVLTGSGQAAYVDIDLKDANYIKLYAHENGYNGNDHAVYGDAKLVKSDYTISKTPITGLHPLSYYDDILGNETIENNIENNEMLILQRAFVKRVGYEGIQRTANKGEKYVDGINYLFNNHKALKYFIMGGPVNIDGSYQKSVKHFCDIYEVYKDELADTSDDDFNLRLAVSIALAFSRKETVTFWLNSENVEDSVSRYRTFQELISSGRMDAGGNQDDYGQWSSDLFKKLPIPLMRWTVDTRMNDEEILWLADYALNMKNTTNKDYLDAYQYITYTMGHDYSKDKYYDMNNYDEYNNKYNFAPYVKDYGNRKANRLWMVFEEGAVCGGIAQTYAALAEAFGRPSSPVGQPGHAAAITLGYNTTNKRYEWMIQNDISGWLESGNQYDDRMLGWGNQWKTWSKWHNATYMILATDAVNDGENYIKATMLNLLADSYKENDKKKEAYEKALTHQKINLDSMEGLINCYKADATTSTAQYLALGKRIIETYRYYPQVMMEVLALVEGQIRDSGALMQLDMLKRNALVAASKATPNETSNVNATVQLAKYYLGDTQNELASFSFDGENANKIVLNSKYNDSQVMVRYSLDGGSSWTNTSEKVISLSDDEISKINANDDITVGLVGTDDVFVIDILPGKDLSQSVVYANDLENTFVGATDNLEFSIDGGVTWCNFVSGNPNVRTEEKPDGCITFPGDVTVKARYKANGKYLKGDEFEYKFTKDSEDDTRKYVSIKNLDIIDYTSQNSENHAAKHMIDGNINTSWHTTFNERAENKFITIGLDKVRYITSLEYKPGGPNGRLKNGKIYTSLDGNKWTLSGTFDNLKNNTDLKVLDLDNPAPAKFVKVVADNTYGNNPGEEDMYFSGLMLNIFEDATKKYESKPKIDYSTRDITNKDVTATITVAEGCTVVGDNRYTFTNNGTYTFRYVDIDGVEKTVDAVVDWIDKEAPTADVKFNTTEATSGEVIATLDNISDDATIKNNGGSPSYTFKTNGSFDFILEDKAGNTSTITATVTWIDKEGPAVNVTYSEQKKTNKDVVVTLTGLKEGDYVENNGGKTTYTFRENGKFEFVVKDAVGNTTKVPVSVTWIDKTAPTGVVAYDITSWTDKNVTARLGNLSEKVEMLDGGLDYHTFKENGTYVFKFKDEAGNIGTVTAKVSWIDKTKPTKVSSFETIKDKNNKQSVIAKLNINTKEVEVLNNGGKAEYTFTKNGTFTFKLRLKSTGYEFEVPVKVDWIKETTSGNNSSSGNNNTAGNGNASGNSNSSGNNNSGNTSNNSSNNTSTNKDEDELEKENEGYINEDAEDDRDDIINLGSGEEVLTGGNSNDSSESTEDTSEETKEEKKGIPGIVKGVGILIPISAIGIWLKRRSSRR